MLESTLSLHVAALDEKLRELDRVDPAKAERLLRAIAIHRSKRPLQSCSPAKSGTQG